MGLGVALVVAVLVVYGVVYQSFHRGGEGYDLIVGAKGGKEQLVLNTVFYLSQPIGNIPYSFYEELTEGKFAADVETAIPVCMGHTYQGFRVVGTVPEMFTELKYRGDQSYEFAAGPRTSRRTRTLSTPCWARSPPLKTRLADRRDVSGRPRPAKAAQSTRRGSTWSAFWPPPARRSIARSSSTCAASRRSTTRGEAAHEASTPTTTSMRKEHEITADAGVRSKDACADPGKDRRGGRA